jgi:general secretion pathway protein F
VRPVPQYRITLVGGDVRLALAAHPDAVVSELGMDPRQVLAVEATALRASAGRRPDERQFAQELAVLLEAGIPLLEAVQTLREKDASTAAPALDTLLAALREGRRFSSALEAAGFARLLVALAAASERSGQLPRTLARHADWLAWSAALRQRLVAAAVYPALLLSASVAVIAFLLLFVLPRFAGVFDGMAQDLPVASRWLLELGQAAAGRPVVALVLLALAPAIAVAAWRWPAARAAALRTAQALPGIGPRLREIALARLYRVLALLLGAGVPALQALRLVDGLLDAPLQRRLRAVAAAVERGLRLSEALQGQGLATPVALRMLRVGERSGSVPLMLERAAGFHDEALARLSELITRTVNPVLMLVMGGVIGGIVVLMYLPIFSLVESVG